MLAELRSGGAWLPSRGDLQGGGGVLHLLRDSAPGWVKGPAVHLGSWHGVSTVWAAPPRPHSALETSREWLRVLWAPRCPEPYPVTGLVPQPPSSVLAQGVGVGGGGEMLLGRLHPSSAEHLLCAWPRTGKADTLRAESRRRLSLRGAGGCAPGQPGQGPGLGVSPETLVFPSQQQPRMGGAVTPMPSHQLVDSASELLSSLPTEGGSGAQRQNKPLLCP